MTLPFDLDLLRTFAAVIDTGGFTRAAERVHLTQSTVSQQVKKLETTIGHTLLLREKSSGSIRLTEEGELLLSYARRLLAVAEEAVDALARKPQPKPVRLGVPEDFAGRRLIDLLTGFAGASPQIRLDTVSGWSVELKRLLEAGEIDLALIKREPGDGACLASWPEKLVWVGSRTRSHDADPGTSQNPLPLALFPSGCIYRDRAINSMEKQGRRWHVAYASQGLMGVQAAVASGLGISLLPADAVLPEHLPLAPEAGFEPQPDTELALVKGRPKLSPECRQLADFLITSIGGVNAAANCG
ncbi:LysR family transcriptional regulator [Neorhizobium alkalisoli]|uniref:HTH-type transcriptional regulator TtuA n=1 Tax=Neorhizobium alkalisoli TaxID=528178 RepID=A0A561QJ63_9HYPH|nr:LysR family transcriptional regulator [Neorhizobium alkalisoli]TWF50400.1 LysR family transcriptional regulator [Neorhizobium alkalisoli]